MQEPENTHGSFDSFKEAFSVDKLREYFHTYKDHVWDIGLFFCIGMLMGFFVKKYFPYIVAALVPLVMIYALDATNVLTITFNMDRINGLLGMNIPPLDSALMPLCFVWVKSNVSLTVSFGVGCLIGSKIS